MHGRIPATSRTITVQTDTAPDQTVSENWFADIARVLLAKDAGLTLHLITGFEERTCYRYASGDRKPPAYFLRALLRSEQGAVFFAAIMDGCKAQWWLDLERHRRMGVAADGAR